MPEIKQTPNARTLHVISVVLNLSYLVLVLFRYSGGAQLTRTDAGVTRDSRCSVELYDV